MANDVFAILSLLLLVGVASPGAALEAFGSPTPTAITPADTIHGTVFDSLARRPLAGASVLAEPGGEAATTDDQGAFTIASPGRVRRLAVFHALLDRTGIGSLVATLDTTAQWSSAITLATPSAATLWARLCPGYPRVPGREGIVFGAARTADGAARVAGARVRANWEADSLAQAGLGARVVEAHSDSTGSYYVCGVPPLADVYVIGYSAEFSSGSIGLPGDSVPLRRQDMILGAPGQTGTIHGIVQDSRRGPVAGATIDVDGLEGSARTDAAGRFQVARVPAGTRSMLVKAVGFSPVLVAIDVLEQGGEEIRVDLDRNPLTLKGVKITERTKAPVIRQEFEERRKMGVGQFIDTTQIKTLFNVRSIFQGRPGLTIAGNPPEFQIYMISNMGYCQPTIFLDGFRTDPQVLTTTNNNRIAAVEIYLRPVEVPPKYSVVQRTCGVVLVWTKDSFGR